MSYNIGQLRRSQIASYGTTVGHRVGTIVNKDSIIDFNDACVYISSGGTITSLYSYYLKFEVKQLLNSSQTFTIKLKNESSDDTQTIKTLSVKQGNEITTFELIFNPNSSYNEIVFELSRLALDFNLDNGDGTSGRKMAINVLDFHLVNNIIDTYLKSNYSGLTKLKKIGIQGPPGLLFTIDGEEIRVGRTGIYELYNEDISISYLGFVIKDSLFTQDGKDFFILDFKY